MDKDTAYKILEDIAVDISTGFSKLDKNSPEAETARQRYAAIQYAQNVLCADVVQVVHCWQCKNTDTLQEYEVKNGISRSVGQRQLFCKFFQETVPYDFYCGNGGRRDGDEQG